MSLPVPIWKELNLIFVLDKTGVWSAATGPGGCCIEGIVLSTECSWREYSPNLCPPGLLYVTEVYFTLIMVSAAFVLHCIRCCQNIIPGWEDITQHKSGCFRWQRRREQHMFNIWCLCWLTLTFNLQCLMHIQLLATSRWVHKTNILWYQACLKIFGQHNI